MAKRQRNPFPQADRLKERLVLETPPSGLNTHNTHNLEYLKLKFSELPISRKTLIGLSKNQWVSMTPIQRSSIPHALAGRDLLGTALTGSGKSLAFFVPMLEKLYREKWTKMDGLGSIVLVPTRELGIQLFETLKKVGEKHSFSAGLVIGGKDLKSETERIGGMNVLIATPGRLLQHMQESPEFNADNLQMLVIDEADRILDMGFEETLNEILSYLTSSRQTLLFSATLSKSIQALAKLSLKNPEYINVMPNNEEIATQNKLTQYYMVVDLPNKLSLLFSFLKSHLKSKIIVFLSSCKQVRFTYEAFKKLHPGIPLLEIHGKQKQSKRTSIYFEFLEKENSCLFATDIAARGLDFPTVHWVVQVDCPEDVESYVHRVGRTARYKSGGNSLLFLTESELAFLDLLTQKGINMKKINPNPKRAFSIVERLKSSVAESVELKHLAQRYFVSYVRSIFLMPNKEVFDVKSLPLKEFSESLGLYSQPSVSISETTGDSVKKTKLQKFKEKIQAKKQAKAELLTLKRQNHELHTELQEDPTSQTEFTNKGTEDVSGRLINKAKSSAESAKAQEKARIQRLKVKKKQRLRTLAGEPNQEE